MSEYLEAQENRTSQSPEPQSLKASGFNPSIRLTPRGLALFLCLKICARQYQEFLR